MAFEVSRSFREVVNVEEVIFTLDGAGPDLTLPDRSSAGWLEVETVFMSVAFRFFLDPSF